MYCNSLNENPYPFNRRLSGALGVSHSWVAFTCNRPAAAGDRCFRSPLEIQPSTRAHFGCLQARPRGVLRQAERLRQIEAKQGANAVVDALTKHAGSKPAHMGSQWAPAKWVFLAARRGRALGPRDEAGTRM